MALRRRMIWSSIALGLVVTMGTAGAQPPPQGPPPYTPAADAKDLKSVLFNWTWHMGMLRGVDEHELAVSLEYQGTGTIQVNGQPCTLTKYRSSTNYQLPGQRIQYTCTRSNGQPYSAVEVVSGTYAWNEDIPGAELVAGQGKATPMPRAVQERLIRLWASPQGAAKAALAGAGLSLTAADRNPGGRLQEGVAKIGDTTVAWEGSKPVVTFPIPGVSGATATATLDDRFMAERVVVTQGSTTTEFDVQQLRRLEQPAEQDRSLLRRQARRAAQRHGRPRPDDDRDGNGQRLRRDAGAGERRQSGRFPAVAERSDGSTGIDGRDAAYGQWQAGPHG